MTARGIVSGLAVVAVIVAAGMSQPTDVQMVPHGQHR
jgi:hypothetical protein